MGQIGHLLLVFVVRIPKHGDPNKNGAELVVFGVLLANFSDLLNRIAYLLLGWILVSKHINLQVFVLVDLLQLLEDLYSLLLELLRVKVDIA